MKGRLKMKALIFKREGQVDLQEIEKPVCGSKDVIVRNMRAGICGTDVAAYKFGGIAGGIFPDREEGHEFGHEMVGYVEEIGEDVSDIAVGTRVFVHPIRRTDNPSLACMASGFSQYVKVENAKMDYNLFVLPDELSYDEAVLIEPYAVGTHGKNRPEATADDHVVIFGAGTIGLSALSSLVASGNQKVVVLDIDDNRLKKVEKIGGKGFNPMSGDTKAFLIEHFGEIKKEYGPSAVNVDVYIDCAGASNIPVDFLAYAKQGAKLSCVALQKKDVAINFRQIMSTEAEIMGSRGYSDRDILEVIENLTEKATDVSQILTHQFKMEDYQEAFETACQPDKAVKVVINLE